MKAFQLKRFGHMMAWTLRGERKNWLAVGVAACAAYFLFLGYPIWKSHGGEVDAERGVITCVGMTCGIYVVLLTQLIANLKTKEKRVAYLSLPASPLEKYLSRLLYVGLLVPLTLPVAFVAADLLATLFAWTVGSPYALDGIAFAWSLAAKFFAGLDNDQVRVVAYGGVTLAMAVVALLMLCSTLFRRGPQVAAVVFVVTVFALGKAILWLGDSGFIFRLSETEAEWAFGLAGTALLLVTLGELWLSYRVFRRLQVVPGRFTNL